MKQNSNCLLLLLFALTLCVLFIKLGSYPLIEPSDARYAEISREMYITGDYLTPRLNGIKHFHKPPLLYWAVTAGYRLLGVNEWGARVCQGIFSLGVLLVLFMVGIRLLGKKSSWIPPLLLLFSPGFLGAERNLTTDMLLLFTVTSAMASFLFFYLNEGKGISIYLFYLFSGLSILTKGPMGVVVIFPVLLLFLLWDRNISFLFRMKPVLGGLILLFIALPWYVAVSFHNPGLFTYFVKEQVLSRVAGGGMGHRHSSFYFLWIFPLLTFPWIFFFPQSFKGVFDKGRSVGEASFSLPGSSRMFLVIWALFPPLFFSIPMTKLPLYALSSLPPVALLAAGTVRKHMERREGNSLFFSCLGLLILFLGISMVFLPHFLALKKGLGGGDEMKVVAFVGALPMMGGGVWILKGRGAPDRSMKILMGSFALCIFLLLYNFDKFPFPSSRAVAREIAGGGGKSCPEIVLYNVASFGVPFYTGCPTTLVDVTRDLRFEKGGRSYFMLSRNRLARDWEAKRPLFLIMKSRREFPLHDRKEIVQKNGFSLYAPP